MIKNLTAAHSRDVPDITQKNIWIILNNWIIYLDYYIVFPQYKLPYLLLHSLMLLGADYYIETGGLLYECLFLLKIFPSFYFYWPQLH